MAHDHRILRVLWTIPTMGSRFGGPTSTAANGLIAEHQAGMESDLVTTIGSSESVDDLPEVRRLIDHGVSVRLFRRNLLGKRGEAWGLSPKLAFWLLRNVRRYDVVHLQYVWCMTSIVGAIAATIWRVPLAVTPHESLTDFDIEIASRRRLLRRGKQLLRHLFLATADRLIFMSQLEQRDTRYGSTSAEIISHAVLAEPAQPAPDLGRTGSGLEIAFLGRNIEKKRIHLIVEAIARQKRRDWRLSIAGPVGEEEYVTRVRELSVHLGVEDRVRWLGYIPSRRDLLRQSDLLVMPSVYEGFGMVAAEAMCAGIPVVVPRRSGVAEVVDEYDAGAIMEESTVDELEQALVLLDDSPELLRQKGENGLRAANERLSFSAYARRTGALYSSLTR